MKAFHNRWYQGSVGLTPARHVEVLADLEKEVAAGKTPESVVGMLAAKSPSDAYPNVHYRTLIEAELLGYQSRWMGK